MCVWSIAVTLHASVAGILMCTLIFSFSRISFKTGYDEASSSFFTTRSAFALFSNQCAAQSTTFYSF